ncbi:hypothetical protein [Streptomyces sp. NPDC054849]
MSDDDMDNHPEAAAPAADALCDEIRDPVPRYVPTAPASPPRRSPP